MFDEVSMNDYYIESKQVNPLTVLLDGDYCVYRCCFSVKDNDLELTLQAVDKLISDIKEFCNAGSVRVFLSGSNNFREKVAVTTPYKGNRDRSKRPEHYDAVRQYLITKHNAEVIDGYEADDAMGVYQTEDTIIATVDKDLRQIPGKYLNIYKTPWTIEEITKEDGDLFFWNQLVIGDPNDDIIGIPGLGIKKTTKLFLGKSVSDLRDIVIEEYVKFYGSEGLKRFDETARLIFIKRKSLETEYYNYY